MKYNIGDTLYCVDPFIFTIIPITVIAYDDNYDEIYYIDESGSYSEENSLFEDINDAKEEALFLLEEFYINRKLDIKQYGESND